VIRTGGYGFRRLCGIRLAIDEGTDPEQQKPGCIVDRGRWLAEEAILFAKEAVFVICQYLFQELQKHSHSFAPTKELPRGGNQLLDGERKRTYRLLMWIPLLSQRMRLILSS
jgi:hypothetical protein